MTNRRQFTRQIAAFGLTAGLLLGFAAACIAQAPAGANIPQLPELNWEQRSDWLNVRSAAQMADIGPAAVGDGVADDTVALQAALNEIHGKQGGSPFSTVYLPPGTLVSRHNIAVTSSSDLQVGNGGLLYAVAMMAAGWDGCPEGNAPGFPDDGTWTVKWEGLKKAP